MEPSMNPSRSKVIKMLCEYNPIYVMPIIIDLDNMSWVRYLIATAAYLIAAAIYTAVFQRFVCPKEANGEQIANLRKYLCYLMIFVINALSLIVYDNLPFSFIGNLLSSVAVNFALTMLLCYQIAIKR